MKANKSAAPEAPQTGIKKINAGALLKKYTMVIALVVVFVLFTVVTDGRMLYAQNLSNLLLQNAYVLVMACGMLLCILTGGNVDLSVGATVCLVGAVGAQLMSKMGVGAIPTILICLATGAVISRQKKIKNGYKVPAALTAYAKIVLIAALVVFYSYKLSGYKGISVMLLWVLAIIFLYAFITSKTAFGRYFYAVGGNEKATKLSGIDTRKVYFMAYLSMSLLAGLSGLLMAARIGSVNGDTGMSYEMDAIGS